MNTPTTVYLISDDAIRIESPSVRALITPAPIPLDIEEDAAVTALIEDVADEAPVVVIRIAMLRGAIPPAAAAGMRIFSHTC